MLLITSFIDPNWLPQILRPFKFMHVTFASITIGIGLRMKHFGIDGAIDPMDGDEDAKIVEIQDSRNGW